MTTETLKEEEPCRQDHHKLKQFGYGLCWDCRKIFEDDKPRIEEPKATYLPPFEAMEIWLRLNDNVHEGKGLSCYEIDLYEALNKRFTREAMK